MINEYQRLHEEIEQATMGADGYPDFTHGFMTRGQRRHTLTSRYAWAIPDQAAIDFLVHFSPIIEIGAGTGYWAKLVQDAGGVVFPFDAHPPESSANPYRHVREFTSILEGSCEVLDRFDRKHSLFLCWPPYDDEMATDCVKRYKGDIVIFVGEDQGGCNASDSFFELMYQEWDLLIEHRIPQWDGIHDRFYVYARKGCDTAALKGCLAPEPEESFDAQDVRVHGNMVGISKEIE